MRLLKSRYWIFLVLIVFLFSLVFMRMYQLQITNYSEYQAKAEEKKTKTLTSTGKRGTIYDSNMITMAHDRLTYNVQFYRDPSATSEEYRRMYTESIVNAIDLIESSGKQTVDEFWLKRDERGNWVFDTGTEVASVAEKREKQWRENFYVTGVAVEDLFQTLCDKYFIDPEFPEEKKLKVLAVWQLSRMYNYLSKPVTIAYGVSYETVSRIEAMQTDLPGISIAESSERVYPKGTLASHVIGYVGKINDDDEMATYREKGYPYDASVGQTGIEASMEDYLTANLSTRQGEQTVEINNKGKIIRELSNKAPTDGNDVILTIDTQLQKVLEAALEKNIKGINSVQRGILDSNMDWHRTKQETLAEYEKTGREIQLAQSGAAIAMDPNTGEVLAIASYPSYDLSYFTGGIDAASWSEIMLDDRNPLFNRAVSTRDTPGSIFKMVTALGGLMEGVLTPEREISDGGYFMGTDASYQPRCWINLSRISEHANLTVVGGLSHSCNFFFYTVGRELGSKNITKWAAALGLTSKTGIELPNERVSIVGNQEMLYDSSRAISDQYTSKPQYAANQIKKRLREVGEDRNIKYDEDRLDRVAKKILDLVTEGGSKDEWIGQIQKILINDMNIPSEYIKSHYLINLFYSYINDLRWTENETIMAAIGQSITQVSPIAVARYVSAVANGGTVYDATIIDKIVSPDGTVLLDNQPVVANKIEGENAQEYLALIRTGMEDVTNSEEGGTAADAFKETGGIKIAAKTGTSQRTKLDIENNAWLVTYAPAEDPQIVVVVYVQNGYGGYRLSNTAITTIRYYLENQPKSESTKINPVNTLAE